MSKRRSKGSKAGREADPPATVLVGEHLVVAAEATGALLDCLGLSLFSLSTTSPRVHGRRSAGVNEEGARLTYSCRASCSSCRTSSRALRTAALAWLRALSAAASAASASVTLRRADLMLGSLLRSVEWSESDDDERRRPKRPPERVDDLVGPLLLPLGWPLLCASGESELRPKKPRLRVGDSGGGGGGEDEPKRGMAEEHSVLTPKTLLLSSPEDREEGLVECDDEVVGVPCQRAAYIRLLERLPTSVGHHTRALQPLVEVFVLGWG